MPIYQYVCPHGHWTELLRGMSRRKEPVECSVCGAEAHYAIKGGEVDPEPAQNGVKIWYRHGKPKVEFHFRDYVCECGHEDFVDCTNDDQEFDISVARCSECGSSNLKILSPVHMIDRFSERFPYFDRGLGIMLRSKAHRREVCRQRGLTPVDGNFDIAETTADQRRQEAEDVAILKKMRHLMDDHPGYSEYRRMKDRGWKPNFKHRKQ